jgi:glycosyltransferase involved in cell wall biosynthesis
MSTILVSIIIPTYNQQDVILKAINSCLQQTYEHIEIIIADDNSTDNTEHITRSLNDVRVSYFKNPVNLGRVKNYHHALYNIANGDYVVVLDGDDYYIDHLFIERAVAEILKLKDGEVLFYKAGCISIKTWKKTNSIIKKVESAHIVCNAIDYLKNIKQYGFAHLGIIYNRKKAIETGFYIYDISSSDMDSIFRLILNYPEQKVIVSNLMIGAWVKHSSNTSSNLRLNDFLNSTVRLYFNTIKHPTAKKNNIAELWAIQQSIKPTLAFSLRKLGFKF